MQSISRLFQVYLIATVANVFISRPLSMHSGNKQGRPLASWSGCMHDASRLTQLRSGPHVLEVYMTGATPYYTLSGVFPLYSSPPSTKWCYQ